MKTRLISFITFRNACHKTQKHQESKPHFEFTSPQRTSTNSPLIWMSMKPGQISASWQSTVRSARTRSSKNTGSGLSMRPPRTQKSSLTMAPSRTSRQFLNCIILEGAMEGMVRFYGWGRWKSEVRGRLWCSFLCFSSSLSTSYLFSFASSFFPCVLDLVCHSL